MTPLRFRPGHALWGIVALQVAASACAVLRRPESAPSPPSADAPQARNAVSGGEVTLSVTNRHYLDVVVYVLHDGASTRVGTITGSTSRVFVLPRRLLGQAGEIQLVGDAIGSPEAARTELLILRPGLSIEWTLESDLRRSSVGVF